MVNTIITECLLFNLFDAVPVPVPEHGIIFGVFLASC